MGGYENKYYKKHYDECREWEKKIGSYIVEILKIKSVIDLGCGIGSFLEGAYESGCTEILGIELNLKIADKYIEEKIKPYIQYGDLTVPLKLEKHFDCCISFEVAEHLHEKNSQQFIDNLTEYTSKYIIMTAAPPGQRGTQHFNLQERDYWIKRIEKKEFVYRKDLIEQCTKGWVDFEVPWYIFRNLMVFKK